MKRTLGFCAAGENGGQAAEQHDEEGVDIHGGMGWSFDSAGVQRRAGTKPVQPTMARSNVGVTNLRMNRDFS